MHVSIRLAEALGPVVAAAFDDLTVRTETVLSGDLPDDAALHGVLARLRDVGAPVLDVHVVDRLGRHDR